jgi:16S rRNA (guanine(966)-N(2))-methyltransferase RsmD
MVKGRLLASVQGLDIRPTSDMVREAIFDLIGQDVSGLKGVDLFAGTGSLGIEALSRGARWVLFVDRSQKALRLIRQNLKRCGLGGRGFITKKDLNEGLPWRNPLLKEKIDLALIDPPYGKGMIAPLLALLSDRQVLSTQSIVVAETSKAESLPHHVGQLQLLKQRRYGDTRIHVFAHIQPGFS